MSDSTMTSPAAPIAFRLANVPLGQANSKSSARGGVWPESVSAAASAATCSRAANWLRANELWSDGPKSFEARGPGVEVLQEQLGRGAEVRERELVVGRGRGRAREDAGACEGDAARSDGGEEAATTGRMHEPPLPKEQRGARLPRT